MVHSEQAILDRLETMDQHFRSELVSVNRSLEEVKGNQRVISVKLFGEEQGENKQGRLPRVETTVSRLSNKVEALNKYRWKLTGALTAGIFLLEKLLHFKKD